MGRVVKPFRTLMRRGFFRLSLFLALFLSGHLLLLGHLSCAHPDPDAQLYFNRSFPTFCEAFDAISHFVLEAHYSRMPSEYAALRRKALENIGQAVDESFRAHGSSRDCRDVEELQSFLKSAREKEKEEDKTPLKKEEVYRVLLSSFALVLDPHTVYLDPAAAARYQDKNYESKEVGIGVEFKTKLVDHFRSPKELVVEEVFADGPAAKKELSPGDHIISVNGQPLPAFLPSDLFAMLPPEGKKAVDLELADHSVVPIIPDKYTGLPVFKELLEENGTPFLYLHLRDFRVGSSKLLAEFLKKSERAEGILLDLRGNPGGLTVEAIAVIDHFVDRGRVFTRYRYPAKKIPDEILSREAGFTSAIQEAKQAGSITHLPLVILTDQYTSSAAEIVAGALGASGRAILVGERTYGKATEQRPFNLSMKNGFGGLLLITMYKNVLFDGSGFQAYGIRPHFFVPDPPLAEFLEANKKSPDGKKIYLVEEDWGANVIQRDVERAPQAPKEALSFVLSKLENESSSLISCSPKEDDCQMSAAFRLLERVSEIKPTWPEIHL